MLMISYLILVLGNYVMEETLFMTSMTYKRSLSILMKFVQFPGAKAYINQMKIQTMTQKEK